MSRLDTELVRLGLARARGHAAELVAGRRVLVDGRVASKVAQRVDADTRVELLPGSGPDYVGRGAHKLAGVLDELEVASPPGVPVDGRRCLDAGSSTGGFTQVLLERGARQVLAVDVGHDQLASALREDSRVLDLSGTTVRGLRPSAIGGPVDLVVADLSFISLSLVLADLRCLVRSTGQLVVLVKPQFEVGRERLGSGGVVRDPQLRAEVVQRVCDVGVGLRLGVRAVRASRWPGPSGNVEYFVWFATGPDADGPPVATGRHAAGTIDPEGVLDAAAGTTDPGQIESAVRAAVEEGPT
jgi:23S rRNA (cytidine1920-2'-O)/16S rRNA (cytidine1409-2'-O)-methyltransferase